MKGKELRKKVKEYSHRTNFYKLGLIKKYLKMQEKEEHELINAIPKVICPKCGSYKVSRDSDGDEYSSGSWLYCKDCNETFGDTFDYIEAIANLDAFAWRDRIAIELHFEEPDIKSYRWQEFCEKEIKKYLGLIKEEPILNIF